jgi:hypothetical protein
MATARRRRPPAAPPAGSARSLAPPSPADFETLGQFYLGRPWDPGAERAEAGAERAEAGVVLYDSRDLVTHAVCVGMTGSGKTGLCVALLEEAALDGIPAILIDPKGDLGNLLLTFPDLRAADFRPWIDEAAAAREGLDPDAFAAREAERWTQGLAAWGQDGSRIARLRQAADVAIYTPGSTAGLPLSIMASFEAPPAAVRDDDEQLRERVQVTASSVLGLAGVDADPVRSREHILVSTIVQAAWAAGRDLDLPGIIQQIQAPPVTRVGVLELEAFYPARERFELAMALNNLLAAPGFSAWTEGEPLDPARLLRAADGRPRLAIVSIAHLGERERLFVVALLLSQVAAWMRAQSGTSSLRALLYMDEIFGFFPPVANPPTKPPLLTLLKQARAYGLGVVLATQNPVDLDYKGLANAGTWLIGRLQTERDKARLLEGLEGAAAAGFDRAQADRALSSLRSRVFLMHNVHDDAPVVFESRWAMSYLRGPLTRAQIRTLMARREAGPAPAAPERAPIVATPSPPAVAGAAAPAGAAPPSPARPVLPPDVPQYFLPVRMPRPADGARLAYTPMLLGAARIRFADARTRLDTTEDAIVVAPFGGAGVAVDWDRAAPATLTVEDLEREPAAEGGAEAGAVGAAGAGAVFDPVPAPAARAKSYDTWRRDLAGWLARTRTLALLRSAAAGLTAQPGESERDFRVRLAEAGHERRDAITEKLRKRYAPKIAALQERLRRAEQAVARERAESAQSQVQSVVSIGATLLGAFLGRKVASAATLGRATTAARGVGRAMKDHQDIGRATETVQAIQDQLAALEAEFRAEVEALGGAQDPVRQELETVTIRPTRSNVAVSLVALAWVPTWRSPGSPPVPAWS